VVQIKNLRTDSLGKVYKICIKCYKDKCSKSHKALYERKPELKKICTRNCQKGVQNKIKKVGYLVPSEKRLYGDKNPAKRLSVRKKNK